MVSSMLSFDAHAAVDTAVFGNVISPVITHVVNPVVMLMFAVGLIVFAYGVLQLVWSQDGEARERGKHAMWGGLIGMFIMLSAWGIIYLVSNTIKQI